MNLPVRKLLLSVLLCAFCIQTFLVYLDETGRKSPPLSPLAREGQNIWLANNCQACHQVYGFGGFLGPDLTNAAKRVQPQRFQKILSEGSAQMPAYHFSEKDQQAIVQFLQELDRTGQGMPMVFAAKKHDDPVQAFFVTCDQVFADKPTGEEFEKGKKLVRDYACLTCHLPNTTSAFRAPDLTQIVGERSPEEIAKVLVEGRPNLGMPSFQFGEEDRRSIYTFLSRLYEQRGRLREVYRGEEDLGANEILKQLPWFEYSREES